MHSENVVMMEIHDMFPQGANMTTEQNNAFHKLLTAWSDHQENRSTGASVAELHSSRARLDSARSTIQAQRF